MAPCMSNNSLCCWSSIEDWCLHNWPVLWSHFVAAVQNTFVTEGNVRWSKLVCELLMRHLILFFSLPVKIREMSTKWHFLLVYIGTIMEPDVFFVICPICWDTLQSNSTWTLIWRSGSIHPSIVWTANPVQDPHTYRHTISLFMSHLFLCCFCFLLRTHWMVNWKASHNQPLLLYSDSEHRSLQRLQRGDWNKLREGCGLL